MRTYLSEITRRVRPRNLKRVSNFKRVSSVSPATQLRNMAFYTGRSDQSFTPFFRFIDALENHVKDVPVKGNFKRNGNGSDIMHWQPKFDVIEANDLYELHGELPGMNKEDVHIEFTEPQSLVIRGRVERSYSSGTPSSGRIEDRGEPKKLQATVEDERSGTAIERKTAEKQSEKTKFWLSERSVGEFSRTFNFPAPVNQDAVQASFKDGVLTILVPKAKKTEGRRIAIN